MMATQTKTGDGLHNCGASSCKRRIPKRLAFCLRHWRMVPQAMQDRIYAAWRKRDRDALLANVHAAREYLGGEYGE